MKRTIIILGITGIVCLITAMLYLFVISGAFAIFMPQPPAPQITYGEFPFSITYEVDGETKVYEDTLICEFDGFKHYGTGGIRREWKSHLKSGKERITLLRVEEPEVIFEITETAGLPEYYMGDFNQDRKYYESSMNDDRYLGYIEWKDGEQIGRSMEKEEVFEKCKLKIISREYSEPIENTFK